MRKHIIFFLYFCLLLKGNALLAQDYKDLRLENSLQYNFKTANKLSIALGAGISLMNSDNHVRDRAKGFGLITGNGYGKNISVGLIYNPKPVIGLSTAIDYINIKTSSKGITNLYNGFSIFNSKIVSISESVIINFASKRTASRMYGESNRFLIIPYIKAGIGFLSYSTISNKSAENLSTSKSNLAFVAPVGIGLKLRITNQISLSPNLNYHFTTTDNIDDTESKGGLTGFNDHFITSSLQFIYTPNIKEIKFKRRI